MSRSAPIHYIWDLNYEAAGSTRHFKESQKTDKRRDEESWEQTFGVELFFPTKRNKILISARNKKQKVGQGQVPATTQFQEQESCKGNI